MSEVEKEIEAVALATTVAQEKNIAASQELRPDIPKDRKMLERIGNVALDTNGGTFSGCKLMKFENEEKLNEFFRGNANIMLVDWRLDGNYGSIYAMVTNTLDAYQLKVIKFRTDAIEKYVEEEKEKDRKEEEAKLKDQENEVEEKLRLAAIGEHCEKNHGSVIKTMRAKQKGKK